MNIQEILEYFETLNDDQLKMELEAAIQALKYVSENQPNSDWHESCFAAVIMFTTEMNKRKLKKDD